MRNALLRRGQQLKIPLLSILSIPIPLTTILKRKWRNSQKIYCLPIKPSVPVKITTQRKVNHQIVITPTQHQKLHPNAVQIQSETREWTTKISTHKEHPSQRKQPSEGLQLILVHPMARKLNSPTLARHCNAQHTLTIQLSFISPCTLVLWESVSFAAKAHVDCRVRYLTGGCVLFEVKGRRAHR